MDEDKILEFKLPRDYKGKPQYEAFAKATFDLADCFSHLPATRRAIIEYSKTLILFIAAVTRR